MPEPRGDGPRGRLDLRGEGADGGRTRSVGPPMAQAPAAAPSRSKIGAAMPAAPTASSSRLTQSLVSRTSSSVARSTARLVTVWSV